ncbi:MAG: M3 family metallopeptidase, partial [Pseudomonadota bacterium]
MTNPRLFLGASMATIALTLSACGNDEAEAPETATPEAEAEAPATMEESNTGMTQADEMNIITAAYEGPYGGVPAFDQVTLDHFKPGIEAAMAEGLREIEEIANNTEAPTFENTIVGMERQGAALSRASTYYFLWGGNLSSPEFQEIETEIDPMYSEYSSAINQNEALFRRIEAVWNDKDALAELTDAEQRLVWDYYTDFVRSGAALDAETKERIADINEELSKLYTKFSQNLLHDEESYVTWLTEDQLAGLPDSVVEAAASAATARDRDGEYAILNTRSSMDPFLTYSDNRELREQVWRTYYNRGDNGDEYDNNELISEILSLRQERSRQQGYENFAERALEKQVAKTPDPAKDRK